MLVAMVGVLSHYISKLDITNTSLKKCEMVLFLTFAFALWGGRRRPRRLFLRFSPEFIFSGCEASFEELFELGCSSMGLRLLYDPLHSSLSASFLLFHRSNGKSFDHTKLW